MSKFDFKGILAQNNQVKELPIDILVPYHNHQFKLYSGERFDDMVESIRKNGVLNPILVQPIEGGKYEILSGHNRVEGAKVVGLEYIPAVVKENLSEEEAEMYVIETNLIQRGFNELLISEQAHVLKIQHSKMFSQGKRNDIIAELERLEKGLTSSPLGKKLSGGTSLSKVGNEYGMSKNTVARLLRVNYLIQPLKDLTNNKTMPLRVAVELSYIPEDGQQMVYDVLTTHKKKLNIKQSKAVRQLFTGGEANYETLKKLLAEPPKPTTIVKVPLDSETFSKYFGKDTSNEKISAILKEALEKYFND